MIGIVIIHKRTDNALITELSKAWLSYNCANWVTVEAAGPLAASNEIINTCDALGNSFVIPVKIKTNAQFKKIVALGYLIQQKYRNDIRNMLP